MSGAMAAAISRLVDFFAGEFAIDGVAEESGTDYTLILSL